jgi:quercetin dioxygenase-like cupin family protein
VAYAGQQIYNPVTKEHFTILHTPADPSSGSLVFECRVAPGGARIPAHVHRSQEERFEVLSGSLGVMLGGKTQLLHAGETIALPAKIKHQWWNAGETEVSFRVEVTPARNLERVLEALAGMAEAGKLSRKGMPKNPFRLAQLGRLSENYLPGIPLWLQQPPLVVGSALGRLFGLDPRLSEYVPAPATEQAVA